MVYGAKSAAVAGAAIPRATNPIVPSKNFFIVSIPIVMRAVGRPDRNPNQYWGQCRRSSSQRLYPKYNTEPQMTSRSRLGRHAEIPFEPCIPSCGKKVPDRADWLHEIKHDGYRLIIQPDGKCVRLWTGQRPRLERLLPADHRGCAGLPQQLVRPRWRGRAARRRRPLRFQRPAFAPAPCGS